MHTHHSNKSVFWSLDILRMAGDVAMTLMSKSMLSFLPVWNSQRMLFPSCLEAMPTQILRIAPHTMEKTAGACSRSQLCPCSPSHWCGSHPREEREKRGVWAGYQPWRRRGDKSSFTVSSGVAAHVEKVFVFSLPACRLPCYPVLVSAVLAASGAGQGSALAASDKVRPWWVWRSPGAGSRC